MRVQESFLDSWASFNPQELSIIVWAFAKAAHYSAQTLGCACSAAAAAMPGFDAQQLSMLLWSCATLNHRDEALLSAALQHIKQLAALCGPPEASPSGTDLVQSVGSAASTTAGSAGRSSSSSSSTEGFGQGRELSSLAWSLSVLMCCSARDSTQQFTDDGNHTGHSSAAGNVPHHTTKSSDVAILAAVHGLIRQASVQPSLIFSRESKRQLMHAHMLCISASIGMYNVERDCHHADQTVQGACQSVCTSESPTSPLGSSSGHSFQPVAAGYDPCRIGSAWPGRDAAIAGLRGTWPAHDLESGKSLFESCLESWTDDQSLCSISPVQQHVYEVLSASYDVLLEAPLADGLLRTDILLHFLDASGLQGAIQRCSNAVSAFSNNFAAETLQQSTSNFKEHTSQPEARRQGDAVASNMQSSLSSGCRSSRDSCNSHVNAAASHVGNTDDANGPGSILEVAVEVDGPSHFASNRPLHILGPTLARNRLLQQLCEMQVVSISSTPHGCI